MRSAGILALTHSSRRTNLDRCSVDFLTRRFGDPGRLERLPPFDSLAPPELLYTGAVSLFRVVGELGNFRFESHGTIKGREKIQHVALLDDTDLLVGYEHRVEHWRLPRCLIRRYEHPHLAGLHTVEPISRNRAVLSCSSPDAVLILDLNSGEIERTLRMPAELYGRNYNLSPDMDLRRHFIGDEQQTTHLNQAFPFDGGSRVLVSTLIQGAIGVFDLESGAYEEIARGFVGCHGARVNEEGEIYFADSARGHLVFLNEEGRMARRFDAGSRWLHDVQQIRGSVYAFALADTNELRVWDIERGDLLFRRRFFIWPVEGLFGLARRVPFWLGNSTQALSFSRAACAPRGAGRPGW
ncbi:MAG TPA: hypothetical protein VGX68_09600 [Thermoanaerobaculia bacterium]|jgi:hypothetical protein|nr:hypothetical protein [Thermoanaerobaculia bacterium]